MFNLDAFDQKPIHDLESLFYVILYTTVTYTGPAGSAHIRGLERLFRTNSAIVRDTELGRLKWQLFLFEDAFEDMLKAEVTPYFAPFKILLRTLRGLLFCVDGRTRWTTDLGIHDQFIAVLEAFGRMLVPVPNVLMEHIKGQLVPVFYAGFLSDTFTDNGTGNSVVPAFAHEPQKKSEKGATQSVRYVADTNIHSQRTSFLLFHISRAHS